jgi:hypothetical protein
MRHTSERNLPRHRQQARVNTQHSPTYTHWTLLCSCFIMTTLNPQSHTDSVYTTQCSCSVIFMGEEFGSQPGDSGGRRTTSKGDTARQRATLQADLWDGGLGKSKLWGGWSLHVPGFPKTLLWILIWVTYDRRYRSRGPGFDSRPYQIFWEVEGLERGPLSLVRTTEELLEWKRSGSGLENRD